MTTNKEQIKTALELLDYWTNQKSSTIDSILFAKFASDLKYLLDNNPDQFDKLIKQAAWPQLGMGLLMLLAMVAPSLINMWQTSGVNEAQRNIIMSQLPGIQESARMSRSIEAASELSKLVAYLSNLRALSDYGLMQTILNSPLEQQHKLNLANQIMTSRTPIRGLLPSLPLPLNTNLPYQDFRIEVSKPPVKPPDKPPDKPSTNK